MGDRRIVHAASIEPGDASMRRSIQDLTGLALRMEPKHQNRTLRSKTYASSSLLFSPITRSPSSPSCPHTASLGDFQQVHRLNHQLSCQESGGGVKLEVRDLQPHLGAWPSLLSFKRHGRALEFQALSTSSACCGVPAMVARLACRYFEVSHLCASGVSSRSILGNGEEIDPLFSSCDVRQLVQFPTQ